MSSERKNLELIRQTAEMVVAEYLKLPEEITERGNREGGYMTIKNYETSRIEAIYLIGNLPDDKVDKTLIISQEKANRLFKLICIDKKNHLTSWESRDPDNLQYGGAIYYAKFLLKKYILSFSGLPELGDEACMLATKALLSSKSRTMVTAVASSMLHSVYFKELNRPGQEQFRAILNSFKIRI